MEMDRRNFFKGAAVAAGAAALAGTAIASADERTYELDSEAPAAAAPDPNKPSHYVADPAKIEAAAAAVADGEEYYNSLQFLLDKNAIHEGLLRYTRSMDRVDWDMVTTIFAPHAPANYGMYYEGDFEGFVEYVNDYHFWNTFCRQHRIFNETITIDPDGQHAASETYLMVTLREPFNDGAQGFEFCPSRHNTDYMDKDYYIPQLVDTIGYGRYLDRWEKQADGKWRITERQYNLDFGHQQFITSPSNNRGVNFPLPKDSDWETGEWLDFSYDFLNNDYILSR